MPSSVLLPAMLKHKEPLMRLAFIMGGDTGGRGGSGGGDGGGEGGGGEGGGGEGGGRGEDTTSIVAPHC